jgi:hypothetical protein
MKYDYGDEVLLKGINENGEATTEQCSVVGITEVQSQRQAEILASSIGTVFYTVEFGDGSDRLVPEDQLAPLLADQQ